MSIKRCGKCGLDKPLAEFSKNKNTPDGLQWSCKLCHRAGVVKAQQNHHDAYRARWNKWADSNREHVRQVAREKARERRFGITIEEYQVMAQSQGDVCAICGEGEEQKHHISGRQNLLAVDHDHKTGIVRGLLCKKCNGLIGLACEDVTILKKAIAYLEMSRDLRNAKIVPVLEHLGPAVGERNGKYTHPEATPRGEQHGMAKLTQSDVDLIFAKAEEGLSQRDIATLVGVSQAQVQRILTGKSWRKTESANSSGQ